MRAPFVRQFPGNAHASIDVPALLEAIDTGEDDDRFLISGPYDLAIHLKVVEWLRDQSPDATETDLFIWARGPHRDPAITRLGGLPYLLADQPWPVHMDCPGSFIGQLDFRDSRDLVPETPGDVLMVFQFLDLYDRLDVESWESECFRGFWTTVDDRARVTQSDQLTPPFSPSILHGYRCRTLDRLEFEDEEGTCLVTAPAAKIGGHPYDAQSNDAAIPHGHRFLGQLAAIWPRLEAPYPSVDRPEPLPARPSDPEADAKWKQARAELRSWGHGFLAIHESESGELKFRHSFS
ncbi:MAG: DUF1963 domain-containing protein [Planctomycetes bacterium]|nr:DUF1963 domain-containing protein [Planctomycetota bacterium]